MTQASLDPTEIPILLRRKIEALILKEVYDVIIERSGQDEAEAVIGTACSRAAIAHGQQMADRLDHAPNLRDFADILPNWTRESALELEPLQAADDVLDFNVRRCRYAEMYRDMGLGEIGHLLSCNRDADFCTGYNPEMKLTRTQTIMAGASHCNFRYRMADSDED